MADAAGYFADLPAVTFKGSGALDELAYRFYDKDRLVRGKRTPAYRHRASALGAPS